MRELIIEKPQAQSNGQKFGQRLLTAAFWFLFVYLLRPVFALFAWAVGIHRFAEVMIVEEGLYDLVRLFKWYALVVFAIAFVLEAWAWYNLARFRGLDRRRAAPPVRREAVAAFFRIDPQELALWQRARSVRLCHDEHGRIVAGECLPPAPIPAASPPIGQGTNILPASL